MSAAIEPQLQEKSEIRKGAGQEVTLEDALKLAQAHHRNGNLTIADRTYRDILRAYPDHFPTVYLLAALLFQRGNMKEALEFGKKATEVEPDNASCWTNYGVILSAEDRQDDAITAFNHALGLDPELYEAYSNKAHALWLSGRFEEAEEAAAQATLLKPEKTEAYVNLGIALASQRKFKEAEEVWKRVIEIDPAAVAAWSNWCNALREQGRLWDAKEKGKKALELDESSHEALHNLACVYKDLGDLTKAEEMYRKTTELQPDYYRAHNNLALTLIEQERYRDAIVAARYATSFKKDYADAWSTLSRAQSGLGQYDQARESADRAINLEPDEPFHYLTLVDVLIAMDSYDEADAVLQKALELEPSQTRALVKLAEVRRNLDMLDEALEAIDLAIASAQETPPLLVQKARILEYAGRVEEGLAVIERALVLAPKNPWALLAKADLLLTINRKEEAGAVLEGARDSLGGFPAFYLSLSSYKTFKADDPDFIKLKALLDKEDEYGPDMKATLRYALFEAYEDIGDYDTAFEHLRKANDCKSATHLFSPENMEAGSKRKRDMFSAAVIRQYEGRGCESELPVFIVGLPRSGTTLTEQILSSHPQVYGAGELYDLNSVIRERGPLTPENAVAMGQSYVERVMARDDSGTALRITDKMPGNYSNIGLIHCILPKARIIHCRRNPMDTLLSCYKQNFATGQYWAYNLDTLALQYRLYEETMNHWRTVLPGRFLEIRYEDTVNAFEEQARRLVDFIGLDWNEACLEPHKQKRAVLTASKDQVIRPVYKSSVDSWKRYETQLEPLRRALEDAGIDI